jgi:hypothetical protein
MPKIEIPSEEMRLYGETHTAFNAKLEEALIEARIFASGQSDSFDKCRLAALEVRRLKSEMDVILGGWGRRFAFDPERVYSIDWKKNQVAINTGR